MFKHWVIEHPEILDPPKFVFSVVQHHKSPLNRMIHEAVLISEKATLNSKSERKGYKIARLTVEKPSWEQLKSIELDVAADSKLDKEMLLVREKVKAHRVANVSNINMIVAQYYDQFCKVFP